MSIPGIPGLGQDEPDQEPTQLQVGQTKIVDLRKEQEWRFEVALARSIEVKIITGTAELFGTELVLNKSYAFISTKAAIYTWTGCTLEIAHDNGALASEYVAEEHTMNEAVNIHLALEAMRSRDLTGPRVLILGSDNAGKSTLAKTLTAYAVRSGRAPVVVNLDPAEGVLSLPGTLSAAVFKTILEVESDAGGGWGTSPMSGPNGEIPVKLPLVYHFGGTDPSEKHGTMYKAQVGRLALSVQGRLKAAGQEEVERSGVIIDTPGSLLSGKQAAMGYELVGHIVSEFTINTVVCLGSERLYNDMLRKFDKQPVSGARSAGETISVVKLAKSGGVVDRDQAYMRAVWEAQVKSYFYGNPRVGASVSLQPRQQQVDFDALPAVWRRISAGSSSYANPSNHVDEDDEFQPGDAEYEPSATISAVPLPENQLFEKLFNPTPALRNCVLAVMNCPPEPDDAQETLRDSSCMGFLYVTDIDEAKGKVSLLSPAAGRVPNRALVWGEGMDAVLNVVG
ncbi:Cleavage polyadenylation factor subunit clp1 [Exophiala xenobiotica]|uniref:Polynucleotide 5'-hydroxyl-kinase GRC3 n=1 Tax=Lithohypha guttulata TaxID=1690604 RepID=A0ABR0K240_9EURO|nr:Cleavage polyadenylation factor subunit clp1 [Lithohypha guttulata]KAK5315961.1 Cleavage polyadenylation factor subunit clp1 [Exophiala xenobiotica]